MGGFENPGAYNEAQKRIREQKEYEVKIIEQQSENFEKNKERIRSKKKLDVFELKRRIETGQSLDTFKSELRQAFREGDISAETFERVVLDIEQQEGKREKLPKIPVESIPFSQNTFAQFLENQHLGDNIGSDMVGFLYGFFVQGSAILVILAWRILIDLLKLPADLYHEIKSN